MIINYSLVRWVQENYKILSSGLWPDPQSEETVAIIKQLSTAAPFENASGLAGMIAQRTRLCGWDGILVEKCCGMDGGPTHRPSELARKYHMEFDTVIAAMNRVTWYCTNEEYNKGMTYGEWRKGKYYRRKEMVR